MKIVECPRDAMQGLTEFIPTPKKIEYLNQLLRVGFNTLDFGSFVSAKAIPQMKDTAEVVTKLDLANTKTSLLAIVANTRGAEDAAAYDQISYLGFPLSISETFQVRNTNRSIADALETLMEIKNVCDQKSKKLVTYISMGFGNPYGDPYDISMVSSFIDILITLGVDVISIADTVGAATADDISKLLGPALHRYKNTEIGVHLHSKAENAIEKIEAAFHAGCNRMDGALKGYGGCPMAADELVGNIASEKIIQFLESKGIKTEIDSVELEKAFALATQIFPNH